MAEQDLAQRLIDALRGVFGTHHARAAHARGVVLEGRFVPTPAARQLCRAAVFAASEVPVVARFSDSTGIPNIPDTDPNADPRGLGVKLRAPDGSQLDVPAHSFNGFPAATAEEFVELLTAIGASGPTAAKPTPLDRFLAKHPAAVAFLTTQKPAPESWATLTYFGVNTLRFVDARGQRTAVRLRLVPGAGEKLLDAAALAKRSATYLSEEIGTHLKSAPVVFALVAQVAGSGDVLDNPSIAWPEDRTLVTLGTVTIDRLAADPAAADKAALFLPADLPDGIEAADPMLAVRSASYRLSHAARQ